MIPDWKVMGRSEFVLGQVLRDLRPDQAEDTVKGGHRTILGFPVRCCPMPAGMVCALVSSGHIVALMEDGRILESRVEGDITEQ